jgi:hypothetical protein
MAEPHVGAMRLRLIDAFGVRAAMGDRAEHLLQGAGAGRQIVETDDSAHGA